jgi:hypothetical protein
MNQRLGFLVVHLLVAAALPMPGLHAAPQADQPAGGAPVAPVSSVDLARYAGIWHEIAKIPNRFQKQCARDTLAQYTLRADGRIAVVNQCIKRNGQVDQARGIAKVVDTETRAKLKVSLVSLLVQAAPTEPTPKVDLAGPVVNPEGRTDVVADQGEVDDLLASLGF